MAVERTDKKETPSKGCLRKVLRYTRLLIQRSSNINSACNCTTYHRVVTDAEESHHLNVCWNRRQTEGRANSFVLPRCEGGKAHRA